jgi:signal transduction histidine kinase/CheY-like chemotaxis protein
MTEDELPGYNEVGFLQEAIDSLPNGFAILNAEFLPLHVNRVALEAFETFYRGVERGLSYVEATFESVRATTPDASEEECWQITELREALLTSGKSADIRTADGRIFNIVYRPMSGDRYVAISMDVTAQRQMAKELDAARLLVHKTQRATSTFLTNLSHEIRTPLNCILGVAQEAKNGELNPAEQAEHAHIILSAAGSLKTLIDDVTDLTKVEAGQITLTPADEDVEDLLAGQMRLWRPLAEEKLLGLSLEIADDLPRRLRFDPVRLGQCVSNLIGNAIKFTEKGSVTVKASLNTHGAGLRIEVSDTGVGMTPQQLRKLFIPFAHIDNASSSRFGGAGLGVVLTCKLAQLMGGDLTVTTTRGQGSVFALTVAATPVATQAPAPAMPDAAPAADDTQLGPSQGKRILLVDDHPLNRRVGRLYLEPEGFVVAEAVNGQHALDRLAKEPFDLVLMDIHMPVMDGLEALRQIRSGREAWCNIPVLAFTADAMSGDRERYAAEGMNGYISKPIEKRNLLAEIGRILGTPVPDRKGDPARPSDTPLGAKTGLMSMR